MNGSAVLLLWAGFGCLTVAWAIQVMPGYPDLATTPKAAVWVAYTACFILGPVLVAYWILLGIYTAGKWLTKERA